MEGNEHEQQRKERGLLSRLISIDPASQKAGYALWEGDKLVEWDVWLSRVKAPWLRIYDIVSQAKITIASFDPEKVAIEDPIIPPRVGQMSATLYKSVGAIYAACYPLRPVMLNTATIRRSLNLSARTSKDAMQSRVKMFYDCDDASSDALDAIAVGHCYLGIAQLENLEVKE